MDKNLPLRPADINPVQERLIALIESERDSGCDINRVEAAAEDLKQAFQRTLTEDRARLSSNRHSEIGAALPRLGEAYQGWKAVSLCFDNTLQLAFTGAIPRRNLLLDHIYTSLKSAIGDPVSALYTQIRSRWDQHLESCPWDSFMETGSDHIDRNFYNAALEALIHGDDLDMEDAIENLTGPLRNLFVSAIEQDQLASIPFVVSLWRRPEIILINDFWRGRTQARILDALEHNAPEKFSGTFAKVQAFFNDSVTRGGQGARGGRLSEPGEIIGAVQRCEPKDREKILRCLMLHPDNEVRRYAAANVDQSSFWKVVTPLAVPCATILSQLEQVAGSNQFNDSHRKVFFNTVHRRLLSLISRSDVLYTRGIARIFMQLDFMLEDEYFEKLVTLLDYLEAKEKHFQIKDNLISGYMKKFRAEKRNTGSRESQPPDFQSIPPVVLRKLARDGFFWYELSMHPIYKVAKETIPHINSADRGYRLATNHGVNQDVLRAVGKKRALFTSLKSKLALLSNPKTPPPVSLDYIPELTRADIEALLRKGSIHPELRRVLVKKFNQL